MGKRTSRQEIRTATIIPFPGAGRLDVRDALLNNQSTPTVQRSPELDAAINARARVLAEEAYLVCREHLRRRVGFEAECGWPQRRIDLRDALRVIKEGDLGDALTRLYQAKLKSLVRDAESASEISSRFSALAEEISKAASGIKE